eukprot:m.42541 g.42541  ORF g.42541 m.42541 type:complete len:510 (-) comp7063_c0_seq4:263-1792(-)
MIIGPPHTIQKNNETMSMIFAPSFTGKFDYKNKDEVAFIFEQARQGNCFLCSKPPTNWVRSHGLREGSGFVFDCRNNSRWTDNLSWSDSVHPDQNKLMIYKEIERDCEISKQAKVTNGVVKTVITDKQSTMKIIYYFRKSSLSTYCELTFHTYQRQARTRKVSTRPTVPTYHQGDVDGAFVLLSLKDNLNYLLPNGQLHSEWRRTVLTQKRKRTPRIKRMQMQNSSPKLPSHLISSNQSKSHLPPSSHSVTHSTSSSPSRDMMIVSSAEEHSSLPPICYPQSSRTSTSSNRFCENQPSSLPYFSNSPSPTASNIVSQSSTSSSPSLLLTSSSDVDSVLPSEICSSPNTIHSQSSAIHTHPALHRPMYRPMQNQQKEYTAESLPQPFSMSDDDSSPSTSPKVAKTFINFVPQQYFCSLTGKALIHHNATMEINAMANCCTTPSMKTTDFLPFQHEPSHQFTLSNKKIPFPYINRNVDNNAMIQKQIQLQFLRNRFHSHQEQQQFQRQVLS